MPYLHHFFFSKHIQRGLLITALLKKSTLIPFTKDGTKENLSPRDQWLQKEKALNIKWVAVLIISHMLWVLNLAIPTEIQIEKEIKTPISSGNQIIHLPAMVFTPVPPQGQKYKVTLFNETNPSLLFNGFIHGVQEAPMSETGFKATLEVSPKDLMRMRKLQGIWNIFPGQIKENQTERSFYEINL